MAPPNPFIEFATDPVGALAWTGYALLMVAITLGGITLTLRKGTTLILLATDRNTRQRNWWGSAFDGWLPPAWYQAWIIALLGIWVVIVWALGAMLWVLGA